MRDSWKNGQIDIIVNSIRYEPNILKIETDSVGDLIKSIEKYNNDYVNSIDKYQIISAIEKLINS